MKTAFLDRDGTINREKHYLSDPSLVELLPNAGKAIRQMNHAGIQVVVVTNQSGIGRGYYTEQDYLLVNKRLMDLLALEQAHIDAIFHCPHAPDIACDCRKPSTGMIDLAKKQLDIDLSKSFIVGDRISDISLGKGTNMKTIGVLTGYGKSSFVKIDDDLDYLVDDLLSAAEIIINS